MKSVKEKPEAKVSAPKTKRKLEVHEMYTPFGNNVLLEHKKATQTASGIHIPEMLQESDRVMKVVSVGKGCTETKVGDKVLMGGSPGYPVVNIQGVDYIQAMEYQILGYIHHDITVADYDAEKSEA